MYIRSKAARGVGLFFGIVFSLVLVVLLVAVPLFSVATSVAKPSTVVDMVQQMDLTETLLQDEGVQDMTQELGSTVAMVNDVLDSDFMEATIESYMEEMLAVMKGHSEDIQFDETHLQEYANTHMDELVDIVQTHVEDAASATREEIEEGITNLVEEHGTTLVEALPTAETVKELMVDPMASQVVTLVVSNTVPVVLYGVVLLVAGLVFVCLLHRWRGLVWLGVDTLVAAVIMGALFVALKSGLPALLLGEETVTTAQPLLGVLDDKLLIAALVLLVVGALFVVGFVLVRRTMKPAVAAVVTAETEAVETAETVKMAETIETAETIEAAESQGEQA